MAPGASARAGQLKVSCFSEIPSFYNRALDFLEESNMVSTWLAARPRNEVTLSLLQQRLNDLGTGIRVVRQ